MSERARTSILPTGEVIARTDYDATVATLRGAVMTGYKLTPKRDGYLVSFFVPIQEVQEVIALNDVIDRILLVEVRRFKRKRGESGADETVIDAASSFGGDDDG